MPRVGRRLKRVSFSTELNPGKFDLIAFLRKLPDDAYLVGVGQDFDVGCSYLIFHSMEWDEVLEGYRLPSFDPWITQSEVVSARLNPHDEPVRPTSDSMLSKVLQAINDACTCDLKYTGMKTHGPACPLKKPLSR